MKPTTGGFLLLHKARFPFATCFQVYSKTWFQKNTKYKWISQKKNCHLTKKISVWEPHPKVRELPHKMLILKSKNFSRKCQYSLWDHWLELIICFHSIKHVYRFKTQSQCEVVGSEKAAGNFISVVEEMQRILCYCVIGNRLKMF